MSRYARQIALPELGKNGQEALSKARVLVVGAGGLASPVLLYLSAAGVGHITLVDHDTVSLSNLHRQVLFTVEDIDKPKVFAAKARLEALNPECHIDALFRRCTTPLAEKLMPDHDMVVDAADSLALTYALDDLCLQHIKPLISASVVGLAGYVGRFCAGSPPYRAVFPKVPKVAGSCETLGVLGASVGVMGSLQAQLVLQEIVGFGAPKKARLTHIDFRTLTVQQMDFSKAEDLGQSFPPLLNLEECAPQDLLIELRSEEEAPHLPRPDAMRILPEDIGDTLPRERRLVLCCTTGLRSARVAHVLQEKGYSQLAIAALGEPKRR